MKFPLGFISLHYAGVVLMSDNEELFLNLLRPHWRRLHVVAQQYAHGEQNASTIEIWESAGTVTSRVNGRNSLLPNARHSPTRQELPSCGRRCRGHTGAFRISLRDEEVTLLARAFVFPAIGLMGTATLLAQRRRATAVCDRLGRRG